MTLPDRDYVGYGRHQPKGAWPGGARVALNIAVNIEEGSERSWWAGDRQNEGLSEVPRAIDPRYRDLGVESVYEYGSRAGIHRLLRMFDRLGIRVTAFAAAAALERTPEVAQWLNESDHELCSHGYRWAEAWHLKEDDERALIAKAVDAFERVTGRRPVGWYSRWMPSLNTRRLLVEEGGFIYDSDAYNDDIPYYVKVNDSAHLVVPYTMAYNDTHFAYGQMTSPSDFEEYCTKALDYLLAEDDGVPRMMSVGVHPRLAGQAARASALESFIAVAQARADVWIATREQIAQWWRTQFPPVATATGFTSSEFLGG
ncbi:polysaccharide deacetylase family protein [Rhizomonospora bruguierae]|uniref:polysaccharide deacetylase family protein n=1 Tax=Rhizomonospora bruguierae TaxID=1581705 RepID=UPI001BCD42F7|nr:polysaccharide deacetylase family protein [Micromonospora sp. NBRC 107566]